MSWTAIEARGVRHVFGQGAMAVEALRGIDLTIRRSEITLLMGPSGSGKTTLIQILGALLRPTAGTIVIDGQDIAPLSDSQRNRLRLGHYGFVFQAYNLFPTLTARENVMVALDLIGIPMAEARAEAQRLLASVGLEDRLESYPGQMSGGQCQRVAIARALAGDPDVLLADEPTAALDAENGRKTLDLFRALAHHQQRAVLIVTHDPRILDFGDRVIRIEDGRIVDDAQGAFGGQ